MWPSNRLTKLLGIETPIIQAGMAGGPTTPELVAAVSNAGGLGTLGAGYMAPDDVREAVRAIRRLTDRPFAVNLFVPEPFEAEEQKIEQAQALLAPYRAELGLDPADSEPVKIEGPPFEEQLEVVIAERVPVFSCTFGVPAENAVERLKAAGIAVIGTATTVREAEMLEQGGADAITAQGSEAGGHRGTFAGPFAAGLVGTMSLVPQMSDRVGVPVVAAGGIADGRGAAAALALGAEGVQMGTAFLACEESGTHEKHREAIGRCVDDGTSVTEVFSGKPARSIRNRMMEELEAYAREFPDYPIHNGLTKPIRSEAKKQGRPEFMSLWAGQSAGMSRRMPAAELVKAVAGEVEQVFSRFSK